MAGFPAGQRNDCVLQRNEALLKMFIDSQTKVPVAFNANISVRDEMYWIGLGWTGSDWTGLDRDEINWIMDHWIRENVDQACIEYLRSGKQMMDVVRQVIDWHFGGFDNVSTFLDFASGYGRFTRFLIQEISPQRVWSADIDEDAVEFQRQQFGVKGIVSVRKPDDYLDYRAYDYILVASLFTHLPEASFFGWLERLTCLLAPDGILMFSVNDTAIMPQNLTMDPKGILFIPQSETTRLNKTDYGTTYVTEAFVQSAVNEVTDGKLRCIRAPRGLMWYQDLYVIVNDSEKDFSDFVFCPGPTGVLDSCAVVDNREIHLSGWAADLCKDACTTEIHVYANGRLVSRCHPTHDRPDVVQMFQNSRVIRSGWSCRVRMRETKPADIVMIKAVNSKGMEWVVKIDALGALCTST